MERLQKILAEAGFGSRRKVEELIKKGIVTVNGEVAELGQKADSKKDDIRVLGKAVSINEKVYYLLNKPEGFLCTVKDPYNRAKVIDLVPKEPRVFPVGRLDADTTGALLLTNDGDLSNQLLHPRYHVKKTYLVKVAGKIKPEDYRRLEIGIQLEDGITLPAKANYIKSGRDWTVISLTISEGRKRQVKRMLKALGYPVLTLHRQKFGPLDLGKLQLGQYRSLSKDEVRLLKESARD
ncbi:MAG: pseudouridine synthase [Firmicutes bacterium]|nr:pseudouridine synthase [Bacillota bacterium]MDD4264226.1 pseudouridine synthase [Bacillota bacterium]MDD4693115.1 pseudouridine synthase [Bacillota bacterium]